ncbi:hypothetical protein LUR56_17520 [Streptomyces sp. MT29]|nr:hypothetical protein [Streptomyces sp. MT29]
MSASIRTACSSSASQGAGGVGPSLQEAGEQRQSVLGVVLAEPLQAPDQGVGGAQGRREPGGG